MLLGNVDFPGYVLNAAGARGFFPEGYWFHRLTNPDWVGSIFVTKTTTARPQEGFMPMRKDGVTPKELFPRCIYVRKALGGHILNSVGLSGPGAEALVAEGSWQIWPHPFVISFMAVGDTHDKRMWECRMFAALIARTEFRSKFAIEINVSCPNVGLDHAELVGEVTEMLGIFAGLGVPLIVNVNLLFPVTAAAEISKHPACAAVSQSNSIPWGAFPEKIPWKKLFGSDVSPLERRGFKPGGYSGPYAFPIMVDWIRKAREARYDTRWLIVGGGIQSVEDAEYAVRFGDPIIMGIKLGIVGIVRPWRVQPIIRHVNSYFERLEWRPKR